MSMNGMQLRIALYARVSTVDQNLETQLVALRDYCGRAGHAVVGEYVDTASGKDDKRAAFERLLADMRAGKFDAVAVYRLDRIGRSLQHLLNLFQEFAARKIEFVSLSQHIDTTTPEGRMFLRLLMVLAEYERELIVSRTLAGLERAKRQGKQLGRPVGRKDSKVRRRAGYLLRYAGKQSSPVFSGAA